MDSRVGSRELLGGLRGLGVDAELGGELAADFQFTGSGPDGTILVGIERKAIGDMLTSMRDRRLVGAQLGPMWSTYTRIYLFIEGRWRRGRQTGLVETLNGDWREARGRHLYAELDRFVCSLEESGVRVWRTADEEETCAGIVDRYLYWQKPYAEHTAVEQIYAPEPVRRGRARLTPPSLCAKWIAQLPGVDGRAFELAERFESAREMANADAALWVERGRGLRLGRVTAEKVVEAICGRQ